MRFYHGGLGRMMGVVFLGALVLGGCGWPDPSQYSFTISEANFYADQLLRENDGASLSAALMVDGKVLWAQGFGLADRTTQQAVTPETMYGIGSSSKMFAATAVMKLVDAGKIDLEKPVTTYLPEFRMASPEYTQITVRMLLNHSSGFPGTDYQDSTTTLPTPWPGYVDQVLSTLKVDHLKHGPGYMSVYCNDGFTVIEKIVGAVSGKSYPQFVQDEIFKPLGLRHSRYPLEIFPDGSFARKVTNGQAEPQEIMNPLGSAALYSTPSDLCRFLAMIAGGGKYEGRRFLSESSVAAMGTDQVGGTFRVVETSQLRYGLGWDSVTQPGLRAVGETAWAKGGDTGMYGSCLVVIPSEGLGAAVTGVAGIGSGQAETLCERILMAALVYRGRLDAMPTPLPQTPLPEATASAEFLALVRGFYAGSAGPIRVDVVDGTLSISYRTFDKWVPVAAGLKYRVDGWFSTDAKPGDEYAFLVSDGRGYLVKQLISGHGHYRVLQPTAQRISAGGTLSAAWRNRLGGTWILANDLATSIDWIQGVDPRLRMIELAELEGLVWVNAPAVKGGTLGMIDPSVSDQWGNMPTLIPIMDGRDQNELQAVMVNGEEWMRYGGDLYRPLGTVAILAPGESRTFSVGAEGYTEWFRLGAGLTPCLFSVTASAETRWNVYDGEFQFLSGGLGDITLQPAGGLGDAYLAVTGPVGQTVTVGRNP